MSSSSNYLFILFLLLLLPLLLFLLKVVWNYVSNARSVTSGLIALRLLHPASMSDALNPQRNESDRWTALINESKEAIDKYLPEIDIDLACFIRCITLRVFLVVFLNVDSQTLVNDADVIPRVTASLSDFYDRSRRSGIGGWQAKIRNSSKIPEESVLRGWLARTDADTVGATNGGQPSSPSKLDRALSAYEALWRIIATIVVNCEDEESREWRWVMLDFRDNPWDRQYRASFGGAKSASVITNEAIGQLGLITHLKQPQLAISIASSEPQASSSLMSCIRCAFTGGSEPEPIASASSHDTPTVLEALKFAALLASMIIGRLGVQYELSPSDGVRADHQAPPWDRRKLRGPGVREAPYASASRQTHTH